MTREVKNIEASNFKTRPTRDIDFLAQNVNNDSKNVKKIFQEICKIEVKDGVVLDSIRYWFWRYYRTQFNSVGLSSIIGF